MRKITNLPWLLPDQRLFLERDYIDEGQTPEQRYDEICNTIENYCLKMSQTVDSIEYSRGIGDRFRNYIQKGWVSFSTPVLINFGKPHNLPISCNKSVLSDNLDDIYKGIHELGMLAKYGAGTSQNFSNLRPIGSDISTGGTSNSVLDWIELYADMMSKTNQNRARRGFLTAYLSVDHPEILSFLDIGTHRIPTDKQRFLQTITTGVTLPIGWLKSMKEGDKDKRKIWAKILKTRQEIGYPYILDLDNANKDRPQVYKDKGMYIETSNICNETAEYTDEHKTFACCLSSANAYYFDEWKDDENFIFDMNLMLDCVIEEYIEKGSKLSGLEKAVRFAKEHRSIGLGILGFHSYLQKKSIVFGELASYSINHNIFSKLREDSDRASKWMAEHWGEPEILKGYGMRNTTRCVSGDTLILTDKGYTPIKNRIGMKTNVWNGFEFSEVVPFETGESDIYRVELSNGQYIRATKDHLFKVVGIQIDRDESKYNINTRKVFDVPLSSLRVGDVMSKYWLPIIDGELELEDAYTQGFFTGDGSVSNAKQGKYPRKEIRLYGVKMKCKDRIKWKSVRSCNYNGTELIRGYINNDYKDKYFVPIYNYNLKSKLDWLAGILDSDGHANSRGISISTKYKQFAINISYMLQSLGCYSYVSTVKRKGGFSREKDEVSYYYTVTISLQSCTTLHKLGLNTERIKVPIGKKDNTDAPQHNWVEVVSIDKENSEMTYCFTEELNHTGMFNGIMTGQCAQAPTKSTSYIMGGLTLNLSEGIEPHKSNYTSKKLAKIQSEVKNHELQELLKTKNKDTKEVWDSILKHNGSVQHLDFLEQREKDIFRTFSEISQVDVIKLAGQRSKFIDQGQSVNIMIHPDTPPKDVNKLHLLAFEEGVKGLYYQYSINASQKFSQELMTCSSCEA